MDDGTFSRIHQAYIGCQHLQYGNVEDRIRELDREVIKHVATMNYNQADAIKRAQKLARDHMRAMKTAEMRANEAQKKASTERG